MPYWAVFNIGKLQISNGSVKRKIWTSGKNLFTHITALLTLKFPPFDSLTVSCLWELYDSLQGHIRSLESQGIAGETFGVLLTPIILSRMPAELRLEWARTGERHEGDLKFLMCFLRTEILRQERSATFTDHIDSKWKFYD